MSEAHVADACLFATCSGCSAQTRGPRPGRCRSRSPASAPALPGGTASRPLADLRIMYPICTACAVHPQRSDAYRCGCGIVLIGKGTIEWVPAGNHLDSIRQSWTRFAEHMVAHGKDAQTSQPARCGRRSAAAPGLKPGSRHPWSVAAAPLRRPAWADGGLPMSGQNARHVRYRGPTDRCPGRRRDLTPPSPTWPDCGADRHRYRAARPHGRPAAAAAR